jgi:sugar lactone lactonase YvrE
VAIDGHGNAVIVDMGNARVRVVAGSTGTFYGQAMIAGDIYTVAGNGIEEFAGDGGPATSASLAIPDGVAVDGAGNLLIADARNERIRMVAMSTGTFYGQPMTAGDIYTIAGDGMEGLAGAGGPATAASLFGPAELAVDSAGNLLIADTVNHRVRVVAASTGTFYGRVMIVGDIYRLAGGGTGGLGDGGPAVSAQLEQPAGVAVDSAGNVVIADTGDGRIRVVAEQTGTFYGLTMTARDIYTIAGDGLQGYSGDGGPAAGAEIDFPGAVAVDSAGNVAIADTRNNRVRTVTG